MPFSTYAELQTAVASWLNRDDLTDTVPDFIALAETQLERDVQHWKSEQRATATFDSRFTALPSDLLEPMRLQIDNQKRPLQLINAFEMHEMRAQSGDAAGVPYYYAMVGGSFEVFPTPATSYTGTLHYRATLERLSDTSTSNWLLETAPDAYLYASCLASAPWLRDDERLGTWSGLYLETIDKLNRQSERTTHGGSLRMRIGAR